MTMNGSLPENQKGIALVLVLWVTVLLAVIVGSFTLVSRVETLTARNLLDSTRAFFAAEAGLHRAAAELRTALGNPEQGWVPDGRSYTMELDDATVEIRVVDESGRIDINAAPREQLVALFESVTLPAEGSEPEEEEPVLLDAIQIEELVDAILDWRDPDNLVRNRGAEDPDYEAAGYPYGARDGPFDSIEELQQVMGMNYELFRQVEPAVTVFSGRSEVNLAFAPREVLMAQPGMTTDMADSFITERRQSGSGRRDDSGVRAVVPGSPLSLASRGSVTYSVASRATLPNGASSTLEAVIRLQSTAEGRLFTVARWKENDFSSEASDTPEEEAKPDA